MRSKWAQIFDGFTVAAFIVTAIATAIGVGLWLGWRSGDTPIEFFGATEALAPFQVEGAPPTCV